MKNNDIEERDQLKLPTVTMVACMHLLIIKHLAGGLVVARKPYLIKTLGLLDRIHRLMFYAFLYLGLLVPIPYSGILLRVLILRILRILRC